MMKLVLLGVAYMTLVLMAFALRLVFVVSLKSVVSVG